MGHTTAGLWNHPGVPHRNWACVDVFDRGEDNLELCEMCEFAMVRYVHVMSHLEYPSTINAGCVCAEWMEDNYVDPKLREREVRNRTKRRERFVRRDWRISRNGNEYLRHEGAIITIFAQQGAWNVSESKNGDVDFGPGGFLSVAHAKNFVFDLINPKQKLR